MHEAMLTNKSVTRTGSVDSVGTNRFDVAGICRYAGRRDQASRSLLYPGQRMSQKTEKTAAKRAKAPARRLQQDAQEVVAWLKRKATKRTREGMARYGIPSDKALRRAQRAHESRAEPAARRASQAPPESKRVKKPAHRWSVLVLALSVAGPL